MANSITDGMPMPIPLVSSVTEPSIAAASCSTSASWEAWLVVTMRASESVAALEHGDGDLRAADVDADELVAHASSFAAASSSITGSSPAAGARARRAKSGRAGRRTRA